MKNKLLFVIYSLSFGGAEKSLVNLLDELDYDKFDVDLYIFDYYNTITQNGLLKIINKNINIVLPDKDMMCLTSSGLKNLFKNFSFKRLYYFIKTKLISLNKKGYNKLQIKWEKANSKLIKTLEKKYDCAIAYMHSYPSYYVIDKVNAKRKILWVHNDYSVFNADKKIDEKYFSKADKVVTISEKCVEELQRAFPNLEDKFMCLYNYSPIKRILERGNEFYPKEFSKKSINILSIGRLSAQKGFDVSIRAAKKLKQAGLDFKWIIVGQGELKDELSSLIDESIKDNVYMVGVKENPYPYFKNCDFVVQTSRFEGKSIVIDEAKIFKKPIICTNYNTVGDQIENNVNGFIVPLENDEAVKDKILELVNNRHFVSNVLDNLSKEKYVTINDYENLFIG